MSIYSPRCPGERKYRKKKLYESQPMTMSIYSFIEQVKESVGEREFTGLSK